MNALFVTKQSHVEPPKATDKNICYQWHCNLHKLLCHEKHADDTMFDEHDANGHHIILNPITEHLYEPVNSLTRINMLWEWSNCKPKCEREY